ncbi:SRPBCC family protein [Steroidobacter agaridevorans]|nr:SRPBCC family protein [Steroidobacter agaridevorans]
MYSEAATTSRSALAIAAGIALGAGLMFLLDPRSGRRRRALLTDQMTRGVKSGREFTRKVRTDARNRASGLYRQARSAVRHEATEDERPAEGRAESPGEREPEYLQENWSPAPRVFAGAMGLGLLASGFTGPRSSIASAALSATGTALLLRAVINRPLTRLVSFSADAEQGFMIQKTLEVYAEVDEVYGAWRSLENFPQFMTHVREVTPTGDRRYQWVVDGPAGVPVTWEAEITNDIPNELIAWRTVPEASVQSSGEVHFEPTSTGGTRIQVRMWYRPPANLVGHAAAWMFARDPKHQIDEDLLRFKSFLETGATGRAEDSALRH